MINVIKGDLNFETTHFDFLIGFVTFVLFTSQLEALKVRDRIAAAISFLYLLIFLRLQRVDDHLVGLRIQQLHRRPGGDDEVR